MPISSRAAVLGVLIGVVLATALFLVAPARVQEGGPDRPAQAAAMKSLALRSLNNSLRYLHTTWWRRFYSYESTTPALPATAATGAAGPIEIALPRGGFSADGVSVRAQASAMYATAIALRRGYFRSQTAGVSEAEATRRAAAWASALARSYQRDGWGRGWQSALWVYYLGYGARQIWPSLLPSTQGLVTHAVASEADSLLAVPPRYYRGSSGTIRYPGDSKAEEDAWNSALLLLAAREFGENPHAAEWLRQGELYALAAYATPDQVGTDPRLRGSNVNPNGTIVNRWRIHPDYMISQAEFIAKAELLSADTRSSVPTEATNNLPLVWSALTRLTFSPQKFARPGGTIYRRDSQKRVTPMIYYPEGTDISQYRRFNAAQMDVEAFCQQIDPASYDWATAHLTYVLQLQSRYADGHIFSLGSTNNAEDEQFAAATEAEIAARLESVK